ncbi:unnamed protein product [Mytilus edulis]|uniref:G-protein coupled receptors family 1 profile domain-containing protein n=1 Tax=Mytilus edulis TaxID=6550 RepID=A0A8S3QD72_MYTED|nr:unnamed protein product [Mytilus edulis]
MDIFDYSLWNIKLKYVGCDITAFNTEQIWNEVFVANLAFADLCVGIFYVLPETLFNRFEVKWNPHVCYMYYAYFSMVPFYVSTYAIVVLSIDRAYVIVKPLAAASKGNTYRYGLALSSWITGCVLAIPYGVFGLYTEDNSCGHKFPNELVS